MSAEGVNGILTVSLTKLLCKHCFIFVCQIWREYHRDKDCISAVIPVCTTLKFYLPHVLCDLQIMFLGRIEKQNVFRRFYRHKVW